MKNELSVFLITFVAATAIFTYAGMFLLATAVQIPDNEDIMNNCIDNPLIYQVSK